MILRGSYLSKGIKPAVVVTERGTDDGLVVPAEIMPVILGVGIRMDRVRPEVLYRRQLDLQPFMSQREIGTNQVVPGGVIRAAHGVECRGIQTCLGRESMADSNSCAVQPFAIDR